MSNYNKVILMGNLTRDIELRTTQGGMAIAKMGMAINRKSKDQEATCFVDLTAFGKTAEIMADHLKKGSGVLVEGRLEYSTWEAKDGGKRNKLEVVVDNFQFVGGRDQGGGESTGARRSGGSRAQQADPDYGDIPF